MGAYALGCAESYQINIEGKAKFFRVLPNMDLVLSDAALNAADRASLELLASPTSDLVWRLDAGRMLTHVETGGTFKELRAFLNDNAAESLPDNVQVFLQELEHKISACRALREAVLLEWADEKSKAPVSVEAGREGFAAMRLAAGGSEDGG